MLWTYVTWKDESEKSIWGEISMNRFLIKRTVASLAVAAVLGATLIAIPAGASSPPVWSAGPASAAADSPMTLTQLMAATPAELQVQLSPGQNVDLPAKSWVENEIGKSWLTPAERQYLMNIPVSVSEPSESQMSAGAPSSLVAAAPAGDPVMSGQCNYSTIGGSWWYHSYLGFSDNGTVITNVSSPNDYHQNFFLANYSGSIWHQYEATGSAHITYTDSGWWTGGWVGVSIINYYMNGDGTWSEISMC